jgi:hypothetical protein
MGMMMGSTPVRGAIPSEGQFMSSSMKVESKDNQWKPAPIMGAPVQPKIVNNIEPQNSLNPNIRVPKPTLGLPQEFQHKPFYSSQETGLIQSIPIIEQDNFIEQ